MKYSGERYSFEIPDRFKDLIGVKRGPRREGAVSEMNEDLYWRLRDRLWSIFDSIEAADGYSWEKA